jgi:hypothetical protein
MNWAKGVRCKAKGEATQELLRLTPHAYRLTAPGWSR